MTSVTKGIENINVTLERIVSDMRFRGQLTCMEVKKENKNVNYVCILYHAPIIDWLIEITFY